MFLFLCLNLFASHPTKYIFRSYADWIIITSCVAKIVSKLVLIHSKVLKFWSK